MELQVQVEGQGEGSGQVKSGYMLFLHEFKAGKEFRNRREEVREGAKAWRELPPEERKKYNDKVNKPKKQGTKKKRMKKVAFSTRCSVRQYKSLVEFINSNDRLKAKVQSLGFASLLDMGCERLPRDLIVRILRAYDPPTHQFTIRGKIKEIDAQDVAELLEVPHTGEKVRTDVDDDDETYKRLKNEYGKVSFTKILKDIKSGENEENFEFLFMLYTLGSFLAPTSQTTVSDKLVRVMCCTMHEFHQFDWATYIVNNLWKEMEDYVEVYRNVGEDNDEGSCNVGGCIYLLLLYLAERFPLSKSVRDGSISAIQFWTDERIKEMTKKERQSNRGLLYKQKGSKVRVGDEERRRRSVADLHPELQSLHRKLMAVIDLSYKRLVSAVEDELHKVHITMEENRTVGDEGPSEVGAEYKGEDEADDGDDENEGDDDDGQDSGHIPHHGDDSDEADMVDVEEEGIQAGDMDSPDVSPMDKNAQPRRSQREVKSAINSPWILTMPVKRKKRNMEEKEKFFNMISRMCSRQDGDVTLVQISDEDITRDQLRTLGGIERIGNRLMSVVCKTLLADMKSEGEVKRHIFDADFMAILAANPSRWDARKREKQLLPEYVGYNIGDCDLIFGPTLVGAHWFCLVLEPKTMNFYVLDSMKPSFPAKKSKKKGAADDDMMTVVTGCRDRFYDMIEIVKPNTIGKKQMSDIIWAPVPQQNNLRDCGVHVLIWLSKWEPGVTLDYGQEHVADFRRNLMWWLVNHELNSRREEALNLLSSPEPTPRKKQRASRQ
ncbi:uncharacterized protein LOC114757063 [Neltuma alba]|uniref:uncharacterized protein LOC114711355 n=1 Tax=Neltuma alba TaxID=207710 RepID=UPI0010A5506A|nr:uncharacterized protein LOC114711355 [Prosopis alba]XP_028753113.1 uncharacterized protein LOC114712735 [Prosopis alba]XP_028768452.1 uncharacterized protein LOC114726048 [Prosopis alba]XP_028768457.1 uncharacterized protein LOC114726052 [Prosopis alba]XP_028772563.1 uncharacterized protein LOC114729688 [Prosopis alba]XP_028774512.1 uncharacterized protein LOC114731498 [Prosopis alba]XP_028778256.1 uncharacterized protein LOC114734777 [Prosopis alba]XP_028792606.1 uncharacterized protein 